jgi:predicted negative regulator of RcsB-dependent stress response
MAYDLQEQEQLATFKAWWEKYGNLILTAATIVLFAIAAFNGWRWYEREQGKDAGREYDKLIAAMETKDPAKIKEAAGGIIEKYNRTIYASLAALQAAKAYHDSGDSGGAKAQLRWVIDKSGRPELAATARVRLAGVLLDDKAYDEALKVLADNVPQSHAVQFADRRGDVLVAMKKLDEARAAYKEALDKAAADNPLRAYIQLKLDALPAPAAS